MAFTTPSIRATTDLISSAIWNTDLVADILWVATDAPYAHVFHSVSQSITNGLTDVAQLFDSERFDNASMHDTSTNTPRLTIPAGGGGKYIHGGNWELNNAQAGASVSQMKFRIGGSTVFMKDQRYFLNSVLGLPSQLCVSSYSLAAGEYVEMLVAHDGPAAGDSLANGNYSPEFWAFLVRI